MRSNRKGAGLKERFSRKGISGLAMILIICSFVGCGGNTSHEPKKALSSTIQFKDVLRESGIDYEFTIPGTRPLNILQTIGNGCAFFDYDNDGNLDILLVGAKLGLYKGDGKGHFSDVSKSMGLSDLKGHFLGCAYGDIDGDGFDDLYISGYQTGILLHNDGGRMFTDVSAKMGIKPQPWGTSCAFAETTRGSGRLDLYVGNYAIFGPSQVQLCKEGSLMTSCGPRYYTPIKGVFYRNLGNGKFSNETESVGANTASGRTLGVAFADFDGKGVLGLALANDETKGDLFYSEDGKKYKNIGELSSVAFDRDGNIHGGMGADWGDFDNDGKLDLFVTTFFGEVKCLYKNNGDTNFSDVGIPSGLAVTTSSNVAFGTKFLDFDNDGWLDIAIANGHVQDNIASINSGAVYRQPFQLFRNRGVTPGSFEDVSATCDPASLKPIVGRGLASGDYDNDGLEDLLVVDSEGKPLLLHNSKPSRGHWIGVKLEGTKSNRDGYGAILTLKCGDKTVVRHCHSDGSYLSASDKRVHFGLGEATRIDSLKITWPSGGVSELKNLPIDKYVTIKEGSSQWE